MVANYAGLSAGQYLVYETADYEADVQFLEERHGQWIVELAIKGYSFSIGANEPMLWRTWL